jgi:hypothetical protein
MRRATYHRSGMEEGRFVARRNCSALRAPWEKGVLRARPREGGHVMMEGCVLEGMEYGGFKKGLEVFGVAVIDRGGVFIGGLDSRIWIWSRGAWRSNSRRGM